MIDYTIVRSRRKTITVSVAFDNKITVRCPNHMNIREIDAFVNSKSDWIFKVMAENNVRRQSDEDVLNFKCVLLCGERYPLVFSSSNKFSDGVVYATKPSSIKKIYLKYFYEDFLKFAKDTAKQTKLHAVEFDMKSYKARWGCCDKYGKITFNWLILMLPMYLQRYVIVHELCHTVYFNHSKKFWDLVKKYVPDYSFCRKNLKDYNYLIHLYLK